jgi:hypothetical protein
MSYVVVVELARYYLIMTGGLCVLRVRRVYPGVFIGQKLMRWLLI